MRDKEPQQETLSIRISSKIREQLQRARELVSNGRGRPVSMSAVAKLYLKSIPQDHGALEAAELLARATESLLAIRRKWEQRQRLSGVEWMVIAYYVQQATEEQSENPRLPGAEALADLLEAFLAVRALRADARPDLDEYYKTKLAVAETVRSKAAGSDPLRQKVAELARNLRTRHSKVRPLYAGRTFLTAVREEPSPRSAQSLARVSYRRHPLQAGEQSRSGRPEGHLRQYDDWDPCQRAHPAIGTEAPLRVPDCERFVFAPESDDP